MARLTWQNVPGGGGRGESGTAVGVAQAGASFDNAIKSFTGILDGYKEGKVKANTQAFMDQLNQFRTPEELDAAMQSGAIDQLRAGYGGMINQEAAQGAAGNLLTDMITRRQAMGEHQDWEGERDSRAAVNDLLSRALADPANASKYMGEAASLHGGREILDALFTAQGAGEARQIAQDGNTRSWNAEDRAEEMHPLTMAATKQSTANALATHTRAEAMHPLDIAAKKQTTSNAVDSNNRAAQKHNAEMGIAGAAEQKAATLKGVDSIFQTIRNSSISPEAKSEAVRALEERLTGVYGYEEASKIIESKSPILTSGNKQHGEELARTLSDKAQDAAYVSFYKENGSGAVGSINPDRNLMLAEKYVVSNVADSDQHSGLQQRLPDMVNLTIPGTNTPIPFIAIQEAIMKTTKNKGSWSSHGLAAKNHLEKRLKDPKYAEELLQIVEENKGMNILDLGFDPSAPR